MGLADDYSKAVSGEMKNFATWPPESSLELGDYGMWNGCVFERAGNLSQLRSPLVARPGKSKPVIEESFQSAKTSSFEFDANASITWPAGGTASVVTVSPGIAITFGAENGVWVNLGGADVVSMDNVDEIMTELLRRSALDEGHPDYWRHGRYRVVTRLTRARRFAIALSRSESAGVLLEATGNLGTGGVSWLNAEIKTRWSRTVNAVAKFASPQQGNYTPFFKTCHVFREPFNQGWQFTGGCGR